jgi:hypothetical protein
MELSRPSWVILDSRKYTHIYVLLILLRVILHEFYLFIVNALC